jgi:hypothetical protein
MNRRDLLLGFLVFLGVWVAANWIAVHLRSAGGLLEGLGVVDNWQDDVRRIGFPFQFFEEGGPGYRRVFDPSPLVLDALLMIGSSAGVGFAYARIPKRSSHAVV